jgi:hypothetical protein
VLDLAGSYFEYQDLMEGQQAQVKEPGVYGIWRGVEENDLISLSAAVASYENENGKLDLVCEHSGAISLIRLRGVY